MWPIESRTQPTPSFSKLDIQIPASGKNSEGCTCNKPLEMYFLHKLGTELDDILYVLEEISKSRVTYGISDLKDESEGEVGVVMTHRRATYQEVDESEVVGMQADKNNILKLLDPDQTPRRAVITIVGPGGLEKTTLAHIVYRRQV